MPETIQAQRIHTTIKPDGTLHIDHLPFSVGEAVEVIIMARPNSARLGNPYPLRGIPVRYDSPFSPADVDDWNAIS